MWGCMSFRIAFWSRRTKVITSVALVNGVSQLALTVV